MNKFVLVYEKLKKEFGHQNWWPVKTGSRFEICIGAILTQNTNWKNVEKALNNLIAAKALNPRIIAEMPKAKLEKLIRPSGFYKQKAERLKTFSNFFLNKNNFYKNITREELLKVKGIGKETADSILLYACNKPFFVVDAYTKRSFSRIGLISENDYEKIRTIFEKNIPRDISFYKEFHALIVELSKKYCKKEPLCKPCPLNKICKHVKKMRL